MKRILTLLQVFILINTFAQDTLSHPVPGLGGETFYFYHDSTFKFNSQLCGQEGFSFGTYSKNRFGYSFTYDSTKCPTPFLTETKADNDNDSLEVCFFNFTDSTELFIYLYMNIGGTIFKNDSISTLRISKQELNSNTIILKRYPSDLTFTFNLSSTKLDVYIPPASFGYSCGNARILKLRKTRNGYLQKIKVFDKRQDKPWKKGKKRIVRHYYQ